MRAARRFWRMKCQQIPLCKSTLHRLRASRPLASRVEEEAVRDDARVVRTSVLHQVQSRCLWALGEAKTAGDCCRCTRTPAQASPTRAPSRASSPLPPQGLQAKLTTPSSSQTPPPPKPPRPQTQTPPPPKPRPQSPPRPLPPRALSEASLA